MTLGRRSDVASTGSDITAQVTIGNYTTVGPHVQMHTLFNHACIANPSLVSTFQLTGYPHVTTKEKIVIGSDVWIGRNAVLLGNITIGDGAIIGAFSVVAKDIPPYAIVVGNPAKVIRYRFTPEQITELLKIKWWLWDNEKIKKHKPDMMDIDRFISLHKV